MTDTRHECPECGYDMTFFEAEHVFDDMLCPVCLVQESCSGECAISDEAVNRLDRRVVGRLLSVCDMISAFAATVDICCEVTEAGMRPLSGLDVDLSEHHLSSGIIDRVDSVSMECYGTIKALARTIPEVVARHPSESRFVFSHHPASDLVQESMGRLFM